MNNIFIKNLSCVMTYVNQRAVRLFIMINVVALFYSGYKTPLDVVESRFQPLYTQFVLDCKAYTGSSACERLVSIQIKRDIGQTDDGHQYNGYAVRFFLGMSNFRKIVISEERWTEMRPDERKALIYHELGHAVLNLSHYDEIHDETTCKENLGCYYQKVPDSIMNMYGIEPEILAPRMDYYIKELFTVQYK